MSTSFTYEYTTVFVCVDRVWLKPYENERLFLGTFQDQLNLINLIKEIKIFYWLHFMDCVFDS